MGVKKGVLLILCSLFLILLATVISGKSPCHAQDRNPLISSSCGTHEECSSQCTAAVSSYGQLYDYSCNTTEIGKCNCRYADNSSCYTCGTNYLGVSSTDLCQNDTLHSTPSLCENSFFEKSGTNYSCAFYISNMGPWCSSDSYKYPCTSPTCFLSGTKILTVIDIEDIKEDDVIVELNQAWYLSIINKIKEIFIK